MQNIKAHQQRGELLRAKRTLTVFGHARVEFTLDATPQKIDVNGSQVIGPFNSDVQLLIVAMSGDVAVGEINPGVLQVASAADLPSASEVGAEVVQRGLNLYISDGENSGKYPLEQGFYGADANQRVLCDFLGNLHPTLWSKLLDAGGVIAIADPSEVPGGVTFNDGPVVKLLSHNASGCNFVSPTFTAKNIGTNGGFTNIRVPIYFPDCSRNSGNSLYDSIVIDFGTSADFTSRFVINLAAPGNSTAQPSGTIVQNDSLRGWHDFIIPVSNIAAPAATNVATHGYSGAPDLASIVKIRIQFRKFDTASNDPIFIGPITYGSKGAAKIAFSFDDDDISIYNTAFPALEKRGFKACFFTKGSVQTNNGTTKVNLAQLQELKAAGWTIANHTQAHHNHLLEDMTYQERYDDINTHLQWLKTNGFDWDIFAWPGGNCWA